MEIALLALKDYGLFGLMVVFNMGFCLLLFRHNKEISFKFSESLDKNTNALSQLNQTEVKLADATSNVVAGFDRMAEQNRQEHAHILTFARNRAR